MWGLVGIALPLFGRSKIPYQVSSTFMAHDFLKKVSSAQLLIMIHFILSLLVYCLPFYVLHPPLSFPIFWDCHPLTAPPPHSLHTMHLSVQELLNIIASVLHLGNVQYGGEDGIACIASDTQIKYLARVRCCSRQVCWNSEKEIETCFYLSESRQGRSRLRDISSPIGLYYLRIYAPL